MFEVITGGSLAVTRSQGDRKGKLKLSESFAYGLGRFIP